MRVLTVMAYSIPTMLSAPTIVDSLCAMTRVVRLAISLLSAACTTFSLSLSSALVACTALMYVRSAQVQDDNRGTWEQRVQHQQDPCRLSIAQRVILLKALVPNCDRSGNQNVNHGALYLIHVASAASFQAA